MRKLKIAYEPTEEKVSVDLVYPLVVDGVKLATVDLVPPSIGVVSTLAAAPPTPADLVAALADLPKPIAEALRWTDVETILRAAESAGLVPPGLVTPDDAEADPAPVAVVPADPSSPLDFSSAEVGDPGDVVDFFGRED